MKLHIGGHDPKDGWKILNIQARAGVDFVGDLTDLSQFADASVSDVYASHVLEHVPQRRMIDAFRGIHRILRPGGTFYCSVPDMDILCKMFVDPRLDKHQRFVIMKIMFGGQVDDHDFHFFGWSVAFLYDYLQESGFSKATRVKSFGLFNDSSEHEYFGQAISLSVVATK